MPYSQFVKHFLLSFGQCGHSTSLSALCCETVLSWDCDNSAPHLLSCVSLSSHFVIMSLCRANLGHFYTMLPLPGSSMCFIALRGLQSEPQQNSGTVNFTDLSWIQHRHSLNSITELFLTHQQWEVLRSQGEEGDSAAPVWECLHIAFHYCHLLNSSHF